MRSTDKLDQEAYLFIYIQKLQVSCVVALFK